MFIIFFAYILKKHTFWVTFHLEMMSNLRENFHGYYEKRPYTWPRLTRV